MKNLTLSITALLIGFFLVGFTPVNDIKLTNDSNTSAMGTYCEGWEDGHCEGWRDVKGKYAICPIAPLCPLPELGKDRYKDGYNRGFKAGYRAANKSPY